jgi:hypothetical protein
LSSRHKVNASVVDDGVHAPDGVDLVGNRPGLFIAAQVSDHHAKAIGSDIDDGFGTFLGSGVQHYLMPLDRQSASCSQSKAIGRPSDEYAAHC